MAFQGGSVLAALICAVAVLTGGDGRAQALDAPAPAPEPSPSASRAGPLAPDQAVPPAELEAFLDGIVAETMARDHVAGAAVAVVQDGQVLLQKGYGVDRLGPARAVDARRTLFRIGGITRTFTWILLMKEVEAGRMRLEAPVNLYLPQAAQIRDQGYRRPIQLRDLMTQSPGFETRLFGQAMERRPDRIRPLGLYLRQERPRRVRAAGEAPTVSDYGVALAGEALTAATGYTVQALAEGRIAAPLGMTRTTLREPYPTDAALPAPMAGALAEDVSDGFHWTGSRLRTMPFEYMTQLAPATAGSSTAADMSRYMLAILGDGTLDGATIYSPALAADFRTVITGGPPGVPGWAHGFMQYRLPGGLEGYGQDGDTLSFHARMVTVPALKLGVFVVTNTDTGKAFVHSLPDRIVQRFYARPPTRYGPSAWLTANADAFAGSYLSTFRAYRGLEQFADLVLRGPVKARVDADGVLTTPGPFGPRRWTPVPGATVANPYVAFREIGGPDRLVFQMRDGRAKRWFDPSGKTAYERTGVLASVPLLALLAAATGFAALAALAAGLFARSRRESRQTSVQGRADGAQVSGAVLWLVAIGCFWMWTGQISDPAELAYGWPGGWLITASASAAVAAILTVMCLGLSPMIWRGGRRLDSWTAARKARFTVTTVIFTLFAALLGLWGGLEPWSR
jgi:CubicO group peptidase (beta-lactamase class C family)